MVDLQSLSWEGMSWGKAEMGAQDAQPFFLVDDEQGVEGGVYQGYDTLCCIQLPLAPSFIYRGPLCFIIPFVAEKKKVTRRRSSQYGC